MKHSLRIMLAIGFFLTMVLPIFAEQPGEPFTFSESSFSYNINPGGSIRGEIIVKNLSDGEGTYELYGVDKQELRPGDIPGAQIPKRKDEERLTVGKWISFDSITVTIPANSEKRVEFTLQVPSGIEKKPYEGFVVGERVLTAEELGRAGITTVTRNAKLVTVNVTGVVTSATQEATVSETAQTAEKLTSYLTPLNIILGLVLLIILIYVFKTLRVRKNP